MVYNVFGYKVHKENDTPFGYDMENNEFVVNPIEAEIVKYVFETYVDQRKKLDELPKEWTEYLTQKNEEYKKSKKFGMYVGKLKKPEELEKIDHEPIIDMETFTKVREKLMENKDDTGMQINL